MPADLAICADDFGLSEGIDAAILDLIDRGRLTATSVMAAGPTLAADAAELAVRAPLAEIGLHITLTQLTPVGPMPEFAPDGRLPQIGDLTMSGSRARLRSGDVAREIRRQIERFRSVMGRPPDFVDGHQHVHVLTPVRDVVLRLFEDGTLDPARCWMRVPADPWLLMLARRPASLKAWSIALLSRGLRQAAARRGIRTNGGFRGFTTFAQDGSFGRVFAADLRRLGPQTLAMCHPALGHEPATAIDPIAGARRDEYAYLSSDEFARDLDRAGVRLAKLGTMIRG